MKRKHKIAIVIGLLVAIFNPLTLGGLFFGCAFWSNSHPKTAVNEPCASWLPAEATQVSYYKTYSWTAFEFQISEDGFKKWASHWQVAEIVDFFTIGRYTTRILERPKYDNDPNSPYAIYELQTRATITNGICFRTPPRANGGGTCVAFDRNKGRAFYQTNPR